MERLTELENMLETYIQYEDLRKGVAKIMEYQQADEWDVEKSRKLCALIKSIAINRGMYREEDGAQMFMEAMYAAAFLYDLYGYVNELGHTVPSKLFQARDDFSGLFTGLPEQIVDPICACIEGQFGVHTPIKKLIPPAGTPTQLFADAVHVFKYYN